MRERLETNAGAGAGTGTASQRLSSSPRLTAQRQAWQAGFGEAALAVRPDGGAATRESAVRATERHHGDRPGAGHTGPRAAVVQRELRNKPNVRSGREGHQLTEAEARAILEQLARGDPAAFELLEPLPGAQADPLAAFIGQHGMPADAHPYAQGREYGIVVDKKTGEAHIVIGTSGAVQWQGLLEEGRAVAHLHPLVQNLPERPGHNKYAPRLPAAWSRRWIDPADGHHFDDIVKTPGMYVQFLPTIGDITFCAEHAVEDHTVYTPYVIVDGKLQDPKVDRAAPLLSFRILNASKQEDGSYVAHLKAYANDAELWSKRLTLAAVHAGMSQQSIYKLD